jgi:purine nucleoside permease
VLWESPVVKEIKKRRQKGDYMVVWGWQCVYYVEAQLAQGTAENHSERSIFDLPMRARYRSRYLSDMERTKPVFVIDAVGKNSLWVQNKKTQGIESYPELYQYVRSHYTFAGDFDDTRLYIRNDRAGSL